MVGARRAGLSIVETADLLGSLGFTENGPKKEKIFNEWQFCGRKCPFEVRGEWSDSSWIKGNSNSYNHLLQPRSVLELETEAHQNWTIEDCKNVAWSDESQFLLRHSDGRIRIWHKQHESIPP